MSEQKYTHGPEELFPALGEPDWDKIAKIAKPSTDGSNFKDIVRGGWSEGEMVGYASCMIEKVKPLQQDAGEWRRRFYQAEVEKKDLLQQVSALTKENERLNQWKTDAEKSLVESGTAIGALTEQVEKLMDKLRFADKHIALLQGKEATELSRLREERKELMKTFRRLLEHCTKTNNFNQFDGILGEIRYVLSKFPEVPNE